MSPDDEDRLVADMIELGRRYRPAVEDVSFRVVAGRTLGLVGESGSGKTTVAHLALQVISPTAGVVLFDGNDASGFRGERLRRFRREAQMVFQDPYSSPIRPPATPQCAAARLAVDCALRQLSSVMMVHFEFPDDTLSGTMG